MLLIKSLTVLLLLLTFLSLIDLARATPTTSFPFPARTSPEHRTSPSVSPSGSFIASPLLISDRTFSVVGYVSIPNIYTMSAIGFSLHDSKHVVVPLMSGCSIKMTEFDVVYHPTTIRFAVVDEAVIISAGGDTSFTTPVLSFRPPLQPNPVYHFAMNCLLLDSMEPSKGLKHINSSLYFEWTEAQGSTETKSYHTAFITDLTRPHNRLDLAPANATSTEVHGHALEREFRGAGTSLLLPEHSVPNSPSSTIRSVQITPLSLWRPIEAVWGARPDGIDLQYCALNGYRIPSNAMTFEYFALGLEMISRISVTLTPLQSRYIFKKSQPLSFECNSFLWTTNGKAAEFRIGALPLKYSVSFVDTGGEVLDSRIVIVPIVGASANFPRITTPPSGLRALAPSLTEFVNSGNLELIPILSKQSVRVLSLTQRIANCDPSGTSPYEDSWVVDHIDPAFPDHLVSTRPFLAIEIDGTLKTMSVEIDLAARFAPLQSTRAIFGARFMCQSLGSSDLPSPIITTLAAHVQPFVTSSGGQLAVATRHSVANTHIFQPLVKAITGRGDAADPNEPVITIELRALLLPLPGPDNRITIRDYYDRIQIDEAYLQSYRVEMVIGMLNRGTFSGFFNRCSATATDPTVSTPVTVDLVVESDDANFDGVRTPVLAVKEIQNQAQLKLSFDMEPFLKRTAPGSLNITLSCTDSWIEYPGSSISHTHEDTLVISARVVVNGQVNDVLYKAIQHNFEYNVVPSRLFEPGIFLIVMLVLIASAMIIAVGTGCLCCDKFSWCCQKPGPSGTIASRFYTGPLLGDAQPPSDNYSQPDYTLFMKSNNNPDNAQAPASQQNLSSPDPLNSVP